MSHLDQAAPPSGPRGRHAIDVQWFRKELEQQRGFRLDQLTDLSYEAAGVADDVQGEVITALMTGARTALADIDAALFRLAIGAFGVCQRCGRAIPADRLEAIPMAGLCLPCQYAKESHRPAPDIVEVWGIDSFPASDPPANW
ncbi:TraR/DksA family transcriptional regulator [Kribbella steppae]|uniref:TraR/DksA family transcriptional regulator n=1 Tax=Kribbella steppae TaxID=2512223 RepID=A0A4R2H3D7_9ACTN|nr:TraR/DksA family transcriptional regulator [Kribbella steppae]TCO19653.1 TraR/DksA family transcriptional regulator [Kribbella steppae]